jgi:hypothetical protein
VKKKSYIPVGKIKKHLRRLSYQRKEYSQAKNRAKVDAAVYKCENVGCGQLLYDGKSERNFKSLQEKYPDIIMEKPELDHIREVVDKDMGWRGWDVYIDRLFCGPEELRVLCKTCHKEVSRTEMENRKKAGSLKRKK